MNNKTDSSNTFGAYDYIRKHIVGDEEKTQPKNFEYNNIELDSKDAQNCDPIFLKQCLSKKTKSTMCNFEENQSTRKNSQENLQDYLRLQPKPKFTTKRLNVFKRIHQENQIPEPVYKMNNMVPSSCSDNPDDFFSDDFDVVYDSSFENQNYQFDEFMQA